MAEANTNWPAGQSRGLLKVCLFFLAAQALQLSRAPPAPPQTLLTPARANVSSYCESWLARKRLGASPWPNEHLEATTRAPLIARPAEQQRKQRPSASGRQDEDKTWPLSLVLGHLPNSYLAASVQIVGGPFGQPASKQAARRRYTIIIDGPIVLFFLRARFRYELTWGSRSIDSYPVELCTPSTCAAASF